MLWEIVTCEKGKEFCGGSVVKNLPAIQETQEMWVQHLGQEDPWRRKWQPTPVFLSREFYGQRSAGGYSPWIHRVRHNWACTHRKKNRCERPKAVLNLAHWKNQVEKWDTGARKCCGREKRWGINFTFQKESLRLKLEAQGLGQRAS